MSGCKFDIRYNLKYDIIFLFWNNYIMMSVHIYVILYSIRYIIVLKYLIKIIWLMINCKDNVL